MKPLPLDNWRSRWLYSEADDYESLHRVAQIEWLDNDDQIQGKGVSCCGVESFWYMPGIFSRISLKRCEECCKLAGVPSGNGNPANQEIEEAND